VDGRARPDNVRAMHPETVTVAAGRPARGPRAPLNQSIELSVAFHSGPDDNYYLRQGSSDTIRAFETAIGALEGGPALAFGSGMAAVSAIVEGRPSGTVAVIPKAGYSGMSMLFASQQDLGRMTVRPVDITDTDAVLAALPGAGLLWLESTTNPLLGVADLPVLIEAAHAVGALVAVDATFSTPLLVRPLELGADVVMHSATKYLSGHSDLLMGVLVAREQSLWDELRNRRGLTGAVPGALECYLALRGLRTLAVRLDRAQANALELATRLTTHPAVARVRYPGLPGDEWHERAARLHDGFGAMVSFEIAGSAEKAEAVCERVRLISHTTSLGGVESLIERRARYEIDAANGAPVNLLRLSVGIEHVEDLWTDLAQALDFA
jgi:cystathionine gamma-synthase